METEPDGSVEAQGESSQNEVVTLNVGGVRYVTTLATLVSVPQSYLQILFSGRWKPLRSPSGEVFIDREGHVFQYILQYLRAVRHNDGSFESPGQAADRHTLQVEAQFYGLTELAEMLETRATPALLRGAKGGSSSTTGLLRGLVLSRELWHAQQAEWAADTQLQDMRQLVLEHMLHVPLDAKQVDLVRHLATGGGPLSMSIIHYPLGSLRFEVKALILGSGEGVCSEGMEYASFKISEHASSFTTERFILGAPGVQEETVPRRGHEEFCHRYAALHKLLVQQASRSTYLGLLWLLEQEGFYRVTVETKEVQYTLSGQPSHHHRFHQATLRLDL